jgi:RimJ/RimL family protein N-acetyltransferase
MSEPKGIVYHEVVQGFDVVVRYPQDRDAKVMCDYINVISEEKTYTTWQGERILLKDEEKYLKGQLERIDKDEVVQLLMFVNGELSGISEVGLDKKIKSHVGGFGISIAKKYRGRGFGKLLTKLILEESSKKLVKLKIITLEVFAENEKAIKMYKNFGFIEYGRLPKGLLFKGEPVDEIQMYKSV